MTGKNGKNAPIRVTMLIRNYYPYGGGAERQLESLAPLLIDRGVEISVVTRGYRELAPFEIINGVSVYRLPTKGPKALSSMLFTLTALPVLWRLRPHFIHAHGLLSPTTTAMVAKRRLLGVPIGTKLMRGGKEGDLDCLEKKPLSKRRVLALRDWVDAFIVISQEIDREMMSIGVPPHRRFFIPNGVDLERFQPLSSAAEKRALRNSLGLPPEALITVFTGRLSREKRIHQLIDIWPKIREAHPQALLLILGLGEDEAWLKESSGTGVHFAGQVDNVESYLQVSDLFVLPSATEGLSNSLLEALAVGLPAIATSIGGAPDVIDHQENGWLITPDEPEELQEAVLTLLGDTAYRQKMGQRGRERVAQDYALTVTADRLRALYDHHIF